MWKLRLLCIAVIVISLMALAACAPGIESQPGAGGTLLMTEPASKEAENSGQGVVVDVTPAPDNESQPSEGQVAPEAGSGAQGQPEGQGEQPQTGSGTQTVFTNDAYAFSLSHPDDFVVSEQPAEKLSQLKPAPAAAFRFMNPTAAASDIAELEPADLELRVYEVGQVEGLEAWLKANNLLPASSDRLTPFQTPHVSGVKLCADTMIAPGCSYFVLSGSRVYQMIPASLAGEAMIDTFTVTK